MLLAGGKSALDHLRLCKLILSLAVYKQVGSKNEYQRGEIKPASLCPLDLLRHYEIIVGSDFIGGEPYQSLL